ncbi:hypothetical protein PROFUN_08287 [Planoprotostelium fungivorum]|uniref:Uncharacterized protein n=1 Tax=Planoprotostelium fungivorum TaxID=1890364 RepID=A0A2P6NJY3_9EUKA|nr:hypothetical protein PROFUN_08287 [Planoprotostelium fungivorum]
MPDRTQVYRDFDKEAGEGHWSTITWKLNPYLRWTLNQLYRI